MLHNSDKHQAREAGTVISECLSFGVRLLMIKEHFRPLNIDCALWGAVFSPAPPVGLHSALVELAECSVSTKPQGVVTRLCVLRKTAR